MSTKPVSRSDQKVIEDHVLRLIGLECVAWRKSYGRTGHLHFGRLVPRDARPIKAVYTDAGEFILDLLDCDRRMLNAPGVIDSRIEGDEAVLDHMERLEGATVLKVGVDAKDLSLLIDFSGGRGLRLGTDPASGAPDEQWALRLPNGDTIMAFGQLHWMMELDQARG